MGQLDMITAQPGHDANGPSMSSRSDRRFACVDLVRGSSVFHAFCLGFIGLGVPAFALDVSLNPKP